MKDFSSEYSKEKLIDKTKKYASAIGCPLLCKVFQLFEALKDKDTPAWAKTYIIGTLGYFLAFVDAIPDLTPVVGYSDDLGVLVLALATVQSYLKPQHKEAAASRVQNFFPKCDCGAEEEAEN